MMTVASIYAKIFHTNVMIWSLFMCSLAFSASSGMARSNVTDVTDDLHDVVHGEEMSVPFQIGP